MTVGPQYRWSARLRRVCGIAAATATLLLAACGGDDKADEDASRGSSTTVSQSATTDSLPRFTAACELLTLSEAEALVGSELDPPPAGQKSADCDYPASGTGQSVAVVHLRYGDGVDLDDAFREILDGNQPNPQMVSGLGDKAFYKKFSNGQRLGVLVGRDYFAITVDGGGESLLAPLTAAATRAIGRL